MRPPADFEEMRTAIRAVHGCDSEHVESIPVTEVFRGQVAWNGVVEVFRLRGHPKAKRAFAWSYRENGRTQTVAVLEIPPVDGPQMAVKIAIAAMGREKR